MVITWNFGEVKRIYGIVLVFEAIILEDAQMLEKVEVGGQKISGTTQLLEIYSSCKA